MCRGKKICSELGNNPDLWDKHSPLPPPDWFKGEIELFQKAVTKASTGNIQESTTILQTIKSDALRNWYVEHGQISGNTRNRVLATAKPKPLTTTLDKVRSPDNFAKAVFERDNYSCRYCGMNVIPKSVFKLYRQLVGIQLFRDTGTNSERHGIILAFRANVDHVIPHKLGGRTDMENLVTSCWSCNYGKSSYTIEQLGLTHPRKRIQKSSNWDGLTSLSEGLKQFRT